MMANIGLLGELRVELRLVEQGWHPVRLDTGRMASNADLLAVNRKQRVSIQVKTTDANGGHSHSKSLGFGYASGYLKEKTSIFNSKPSPLIADVVVGVSLNGEATRFVVLPIALAEMLCRLHCDYWYSIRKKDGNERSGSFPIYLSFMGEERAHVDFHRKVRANLAKYENAWSILGLPTEELHDGRKWKIIEPAN